LGGRGSRTVRGANRPGRRENIEGWLAPERPCVAVKLDGQAQLRAIEADVTEHPAVHRAKLVIGALGLTGPHEATPYL